jgi:hypothetical protein
MCSIINLVIVLDNLIHFFYSSQMFRFLLCQLKKLKGWFPCTLDIPEGRVIVACIGRIVFFFKFVT